MSSLFRLGEFGLIGRIRRQTKARGNVLVGIGDDAAVLQPRRVGAIHELPLQLLTTDMLIEGHHFRLDDATPEEIGWKAMAVNLSDIAAMGGVPVAAVVALGLPKSFDVKKVDGLYRGLRRAANRFRAAIVGGDTNASQKLVVAVTLTGEVEPKKLVLRSGAKQGDAVWVTGALGGSLASRQHLRFMPRIHEARWLVSHFKIHAMMDLSDGLSSDMRRMAGESGVGFRIEGERVPISANIVGAIGRSPLQAALSDGEDFELLFTLSAKESLKLEKNLKKPIRMTKIGTAISEKRGIILVQNSKEKPLIESGFDHFRR